MGSPCLLFDTDSCDPPSRQPSDNLQSIEKSVLKMLGSPRNLTLVHIYSCGHNSPTAGCLANQVLSPSAFQRVTDNKLDINDDATNWPFKESVRRQFVLSELGYSCAHKRSVLL